MRKMVRFAPAPSGNLHAGNSRVALLNFLLARKEQWGFLLRFDDSDKAKVVTSSYQMMRDELNWLGILWDEEMRQSQRQSLYQEALLLLEKQGRCYRCYETPEELKAQRAIQIKSKQPPRYNRRGLSEDHEARIAEGITPHWRFLLSDEVISWRDGVFGEMKISLKELSDPVIQRSDGTPLYILTSVVDDAAMNIAHVIRGADHLVNTAAQIDVARALSVQSPLFSHVGLVTGEGGSRLSKREGRDDDFTLQSFQKAGIEPMTVNNVLAGLGGAGQVTVHKDMNSLASSFSFEGLSRSPLQLSQSHFSSVNERLLHLMDFDDVRIRLEGILPSWQEQDIRQLWSVLRDNLTRLEEITQWTAVLESTWQGYQCDNQEERDFLKIAHDLLPDEAAWEDNNRLWNLWKESLAAQTERKGKSLILPLRLALTGREDGPSLSALLRLLGRKKVAMRLASSMGY